LPQSTGAAPAAQLITSEAGILIPYLEKQEAQRSTSKDVGQAKSGFVRSSDAAPKRILTLSAYQTLNHVYSNDGIADKTAVRDGKSSTFAFL